LSISKKQRKKSQNWHFPNYCKDSALQAYKAIMKVVLKIISTNNWSNSWNAGNCENCTHTHARTHARIPKMRQLHTRRMQAGNLNLVTLKKKDVYVLQMLRVFF